MKRSRSKWLKVRKQAAERDNGLCVLCGQPANDVHHVIFRSHGGQDELSNVVCLCRQCHEMAHGAHAIEVREKLIEHMKEQ